MSRFFLASLALLLCLNLARAEEPDIIQRIIELTNKERKQAGLAELTPSSLLTNAARGHAANMAQHENLAHNLQGKGVAERVEDAGYHFMAVGENIAWNHDSAAAVMKGWMESSGHRHNILNKEYTEIGVAVASNKKGQPYYVQVFGNAMPARAAAVFAEPATGTNSYVITNRSAVNLTVTMPSGKTSQLEPDAQGTYSISGDAEQSISVTGGLKGPVFQLRSSGSYTVKTGAKSIELVPDTRP